MVDVKTKIVVGWLGVLVVEVGICVGGVDTGHGYDPLSMVPFFRHTAVIQLPCPSVVL